MSLKPYLRPRLVALNVDASLLEAARAIENNNIGAVVVQDRGRVAGIVTDRDLTVRAVGQGRDPETTTLGDVMTTTVTTLGPLDTQADAIRLMQQRNIRRIPLVEGERLVGMVTLDDLLLDEGASLEDVAAVVAAQLGEGGPADSDRSPARKRRAARAAATLGRMLNGLRADAGLDSTDQAERALEIVLTALVRRLTPGEARDLISQLPSLLHQRLEAHVSGPDKSITRESIEAEIRDQLQLPPPRAAQLVDTIGATINDSVSTGQMDDVRHQLPKGALREVFAVPSTAGRS
jgi:CBS domain-containing protein/uncharacterized protein (DUF2267 family)